MEVAAAKDAALDASVAAAATTRNAVVAAKDAALDASVAVAANEEIDHTHSCWAKYQDEGRKKYFFYSDDIPTFRLFENNDDCGKEMTEPEL
ncbi:hypothetical protein ZWY2020_031026 [Hordeum vulgare]|nr:hypothetical protein ZWY2020_031026 [Hordeum vulgare]